MWFNLAKRVTKLEKEVEDTKQKFEEIDRELDEITAMLLAQNQLLLKMAEEQKNAQA